jgi:uncharacterized protein (DUF1330 family)
MAAYLIAHVEVTDPRTYEEYRQKVPAVIAAHGGRFLVRGGTVHRLEGEINLQRVVVIEFPGMTQLRAFYDSPEYRPLIVLRQRASRGSLFAIEGV